MILSTVVTRFAPSPTGALHLGNARTALFNWLQARAHAGRFLLRCEDTDAERSAADHLDALMEMLRWLGLDWDEGPDRDGPSGPYRQSERVDFYRDLTERLLAEDLAFPCFCSRAELAAARRRQAEAGEPPRYPGTCAGLSEAERAAHRAAGRAEVVRLRVPRAGAIAFDDLVHGPQRIDAATLGDFVIRRADGSATFLFANAVDDAAMAVSHVLRGEDHLANTPRQLLLLRALDMRVPDWGHLPLVLGEQGKPLAKREGGASLAGLRDAGYLPIAIVNHLARIGFTPGTDELLDLHGLAARFDLGRVGHAAARHDGRALDHWQRLAVAAMDARALWRWIEPARPPGCPEPPLPGERFAAAVRDNVLLPGDAWEWARRLFGDAPECEAEAAAEIGRAGPAFFEQALAVAAPPPAEDFRAWAGAVGSATGARGRALFRPLRAALTGTTAGPELHAIVALMPAERVRERLRSAAERARSGLD